MTSIAPCTLEGIQDEGGDCHHAWVYSGSAYGDDDSYNDEGRCECVLYGADGDASPFATQVTHMDRVSTTGTLTRLRLVSWSKAGLDQDPTKILGAREPAWVTHM